VTVEPKAVEARSAALDALAEDYWQALLAANPMYATSLGDRRFDDRLDDPSPEAKDRLHGLTAAFRARADAIDPAGLTTDDRVTRDALLAQLQGDAALLEADLAAWAVDPMDGPQTIAITAELIQPIATPEQGEAMAARWRAFGPWFETHVANLRQALVAGRVGVRTPVERVLDQIDGLLAQPDEEGPFLAPLQVDHPDWASAERARFDEGLRAAVRDAVRPALAGYAAVVRDVILPAARPDDRPGLAHVPGGLDAYRHLIRLHTSLPLTAEAIHAIGLEEVERIDSELAVLGEKVLGTADLSTIRTRLRSDPELHFDTAAAVFATAERSLDRARAAIGDWFGLLPKAPCEVVEIGEHEAKHSTIAYYREPATDGSRPGQYYINTYAPETRPRYEAEALAFHESIPGHHLQVAIGQELPDLPAFRRHLGPTAFWEGWGLYTERLSDEMGLYTGDLDRIGVLSFDAWRACRLVVDTGMHALGWTRQQAIDFMLEHTMLAENNIANEVDRYITIPGQALAYKIGQREILRLRGDARAALGARFDIRAFHDAVLGQGALGLEALGENVRRWVTAV
jgi:uncharacterized protein (DUF885 family)